MDELYLDNIDEYVNDQNKIVTYKWLSLTLGIHVNTAKQMLYHYLEQRRKERSGNTLHATYLVSGKCMENGSMCHKVSVVREDKLEDTKSKLDVTVSVHVYSVQRAELKDSAPLYSTDYDAVKENLKNCNKYSAIRCAAAVPMSSAELQRAQEKVAAAATTAKEASQPVVNSSTAPASKASKPKGIMGMFSTKAGPKKEEQSREVKTEQKEDAAPAEAPKTKPSSRANAMNHFFGKPADKKSTAEQPDKSIKEETEGGVTSAGGSTKPSDTSAKSQQDIKEEQPKESSAVKETKDTRNKTKRLEHSDSEDERTQSQKKKRRRIKKPQSDSSDDEVIPDSPPVPEVHTPSPGKQVKKEPLSQQQNSEGRRRKRRRVLKSRTFVDEEGCIVTEKGYETESYSESDDDLEGGAKPSEDSSSLKQSQGKKDEDEKVKEKAQKKAPAAASKPAKQASIMGFFQKK